MTTETTQNGEAGTNGRAAKPKTYGKRPERPDFAARDEMLKTLQVKVQEYVTMAKEKGAELEALQNESKASSKVEALKRSLANATHSRAQAQVSALPVAPCHAIVFVTVCARTGGVPTRSWPCPSREPSRNDCRTSFRRGRARCHRAAGRR